MFSSTFDVALGDVVGEELVVGADGFTEEPAAPNNGLTFIVPILLGVTSFPFT